jgi:hypothetical protein
MACSDFARRPYTVLRVHSRHPWARLAWLLCQPATWRLLWRARRTVTGLRITRPDLAVRWVRIERCHGPHRTGK